MRYIDFVNFFTLVMFKLLKGALWSAQKVFYLQTKINEFSIVRLDARVPIDFGLFSRHISLVAMVMAAILKINTTF